MYSTMDRPGKFSSQLAEEDQTDAVLHENGNYNIFIGLWRRSYSIR